MESGDRRLSAQRRIRPLLQPLGWGYGAIQAIRRWAYRSGVARSVGVSIPVISVGSLYAGGTGKTPFTAHLCDRLADSRVAVLSRGYKGTYDGLQRVNPDSDPRVCGDEPVLLARRTASDVWVGRDRANLARNLERDYDVLVLDDGYQHLRLRRDLNICLLPNGPRDVLIPAGLMREGPGALADADFVLGVGGVPAWVSSSYTGPTAAIDFVPSSWQTTSGPAEPPKRVLAFAGIAYPERFTAGLERFQLTECVFFPDHHIFTERELDDLWRRAAESKAEALLTTAKDAVRISRIPGNLPVFWRDVEVRWTSGEREFSSLMSKVVRESARV